MVSPMSMHRTEGYLQFRLELEEHPGGAKQRWRVEVSDNYRLYAVKMASLRATRQAALPLRSQLIELLQFVLACEIAWVR